MKTQLGIIIFIVVCVGLVVALVAGKKRADIQQKKDADTILDFSNQLTTANASLDDLRQVNLTLTNDLDAARQMLTTLSNQYAVTSTSLSNTTAALKTAQDQIADLEAQNQALDQQVAGMTNTIANLSSQIAETQMRLVESETNNTFLENELKRQVAEKAELARSPVPSRVVGPAHYDLNVEVSSDGSVQVVPTTPNTPAVTNASST